MNFKARPRRGFFICQAITNNVVFSDKFKFSLEVKSNIKNLMNERSIDLIVSTPAKFQVDIVT